MNGFYVHRLRDIYSPHVSAGLPDGRYVAAVAEPYTAGSLWAAWAVLTGRAYAIEWPKAGDLEDIFQPTRAGSMRQGAAIGKQVRGGKSVESAIPANKHLDKTGTSSRKVPPW